MDYVTRMHSQPHTYHRPKALRPRASAFSLRFFATLLAVSLSQGCTALHPEVFTVEPSALDYLQIVRVYSAKTNAPPEKWKIELGSSGHLEWIAGRSPRVSTGFWEEPTSSDWEDWRRDALVLPSEKTQNYFQAFVDAGVFRKTPSPKAQPEEPDLAILIAVGKRKTFKLTSESAYHNLFNDLVSEFK